MFKIRRFIFNVLVILVASYAVSAQVMSAASSIVTVDFDNTVSGVNNGAFNGSGFTSSPGAGQLDSDAFAFIGFSDGDTNIGDTGTTGDYARGSTAGGVTTGGIYAFDNGGNIALGIQPGGSDFTPGDLILRIVNTAGSPMTEVTISYNILEFNDQARANSLTFSYSDDQTNAPLIPASGTFTSVPALDFTSTGTASGAPAYVVTPRLTRITGINVPASGSFYIRFSSDDVSGSGGRDELGIDDIVINRLAPNSADGTISGRARTGKGLGIKHAVIMLTGGSLEQPIYATTNQYGFYKFEDVPVGESYLLQILSGRHNFENSSRLVNLGNSLANEDFVTVSNRRVAIQNSRNQNPKNRISKKQ